MQRNIRLYPYYVASINALAWMPIFFLYFSQHLSLEQVLQLEALYYLSVVILEVPSGYFSDTFGRRPTMLISSVAFAMSYGLFLVGGEFILFALAQLFLATGFAFSSGTNTSFHYDSLAALSQTEQFGEREAIAERNGFIANGFAIFVGGLVGMIALRLAYAVSFVGALGAIVIVFLFREPMDVQNSISDRGANVSVVGFKEQLRLSLHYLQQPFLRWLFAYAVLMTVLNHIPYEFYQPYLDLLRDDLPFASNPTPLVAGLVMGFSTLIGAYAAARSIKLSERIGVGPTLLIAAGVQTFLITAMGVVLHLLIVPLILLRAVPFGLTRAPMNAAIAPQVPQMQRATYLSIQSLAGRLAFSATLIGLAFLAGQESGADWPTLAWMLRASAFLGIAGLIGLWVTKKK
ncbi:MFS transporter [Chloroflexi bacterium TSY]|nr:MFS transporter [Chloroflexi bacterium TSY]